MTTDVSMSGARTDLDVLTEGSLSSPERKI